MIAFIDDQRGANGVEPICKMLPIAPSTYHARIVQRIDASKRSMRVQRDSSIREAAREAAQQSSGIEQRPSGRPAPVRLQAAPAGPHADSPSLQPAEPPRQRIDKSVLPLGEPKRIRDKGHLKFVATQPCLVCGRQPADAHHLRFVQPRALGMKVSDEFTVPLCRTHHRNLHHTGNEIGWWQKAGIEPLPVARKLWETSHRRAASHSVRVQAPENELQISERNEGEAAAGCLGIA